MDQMLFDAGAAVPRHPAQYTAALLPIMARLLAGSRRILDPFGGVGGIFKLAAWLPGASFDAVEIQPKWAAADPRITVGSALALPWGAGAFDAVCTSPTYGNRMADDFAIKADAGGRNTYTHAHGERLDPENSGILQWGPEYRAFHVKAWTEARRVLAPGGVFVLNCKDHIRGGVVQAVTDWHISALGDLGFYLIDTVQVACPGNRYGANSDLRLDTETVAALRLGIR